MRRVRFVASIAATSDYATLREACRIAEAGGFDALARPDHLLAEGALAPAGAPLLECFTTIGALVRGEQVIMAHHDTVVRAEDHVIVLVTDKKNLPRVERMFQVGVRFV